MKWTPETKLRNYIDGPFLVTLDRTGQTESHLAARRFCAALGRDALLSDLSFENIDAMKAHLTATEPDLSPLTIERAAKQLRAIWRHAMKSGALPMNEDQRLWLTHASPNVKPKKSRVSIPELPTPPDPALETTLLQFLEGWYFPERKISKLVRQRIRTLIKRIDETLGHVATVADLTEETNKAFVAKFEHRYTASTMEDFGRYYSAISRFAGERLDQEGYEPRGWPGGERSNGHDRPDLSEAPDTLWGICLQKFFPVNVRIRTDKTRFQYQCAFKDFREHLGHEPTIADLNDDLVSGMMMMLTNRGLSARTVNERKGRITCLWNWLAKRRIAPDFPSVQSMHEPKRTPKAWSRDELDKLFDACKEAYGPRIAGVKPHGWWTALHYVLWDTGERITAVLSFKWEWLDWDTGMIHVPAEVRKGQERDMVYCLSGDTLAWLKQIQLPERELIFPWPGCQNNLWGRYRKLLLSAGLPADSKSSFHKMRRSVASHVQAAGHDASTMLAHSSSEITRKSYLDPSIVAAIRPSAILFRPGTPEAVPVVPVVTPAPAPVVEVPTPAPVELCPGW